MSELVILLLAGFAGTLLGALFFGGLWWTVPRAISSPRPALWLVGSLLLRTGVTLAGFYSIGAAHWERLMACLVGFIIARAIVLRLTRPAEAGPTASRREASRAP